MAVEDFGQYKMAILGDVKRIGDNLMKLQDSVMTIALEVENLKATDKIRSVIWGGTGGVITTTVTILIVKGILESFK